VFIKYVLSLSLSLSAMAAAAHAQTSAPGAAQTFAPVSATVSVQPSDDKSIRPFRVNISEEQLVDLRRRIAATRWPDRETVNDQSQGIQLSMLKPLGQICAPDHRRRRRAQSSTRSPASLR